MNYFSFTGVRIDNYSFREAIGKIEELVKSGSKDYIVTPNASHIVCLQRDREFREAYKGASLVLPDGIAIVWASRILGMSLKERIAGADLFLKVCELARVMRKGVFLLGGVDGSEKAAAIRLNQLYPKLDVSFYAPPFGFEYNETETLKMIDIINKSKASILFLCVGTPKSEKWIFNNIGKLNVSLALSVGASLDFLCGRVKRSPMWMQKCGFEWLFRLIQEPKRLWERYLIGNTVFIWLVLKEIFRKKVFGRDD